MKNLLIVFLFFSSSLTANFNVVNIDSDDILNVRISPNSHSEKVGELAYDTKNIEVIKCKKTTASSSWCKIKFEDRKSMLTGWVSENYIVPDRVELDIINKEATTFKVSYMEHVDKKKFPVNGKVLVAFKYNDKLGTNYIIYTQKLTSFNLKKDSKSEHISIYHFKKSKNKITLLRKIFNSVKCEIEKTFELSILDKSLSITDLNNDGISEITFIYNTNCFTVVPTINLKLVMLTNNKKYIIRTHMIYTDREMIPGEEYYKSIDIDEAFKKAPSVFLEFAKVELGTYIGDE